MAAALKTRDITPIAPSTERFGPTRMHFYGVAEIVTACAAAAAIVGATFAWISFGASSYRAGFDTPVMFLFRGFNAAGSNISLGLVVALLGTIGLLATAGMRIGWLRGVVSMCGVVIAGTALATFVQLDLWPSAAAGVGSVSSIGIGAWISGAAGLLMTAVPLISRFD
jgi:hypothetical protein